jgi:hypothetical protein
MSSPRRIYVDSRFAVQSERAAARFRVQYPEPIEFTSSRTKLYVVNLSITQTLPTIHATCNQLLFLEGTDEAGLQPRILTFTNGQYDGPGLASILAAELNSGTPLGAYTVVYVGSTNALSISATGPGTNFGFRFFGPHDVHLLSFYDAWKAIGGPSFSSYVNCARVFGIPNSYQPFGSEASGDFAIGTPLTTEHIDTRGVDTVFLACPELARGDTLSPWGARDIIAKVSLSEPHGGLLTSGGPAIAEDHVEVGRTSFRNLSFRLLDAYGSVLSDLQGSCSFTMIFVE